MKFAVDQTCLIKHLNKYHTHLSANNALSIPHARAACGSEDNRHVFFNCSIFLLIYCSSKKESGQGKKVRTIVKKESRRWRKAVHVGTILKNKLYFWRSGAIWKQWACRLTNKNKNCQTNHLMLTPFRDHFEVLGASKIALDFGCFFKGSFEALLAHCGGQRASQEGHWEPFWSTLERQVEM